jgi:hypothetical protein
MLFDILKLLANVLYFLYKSIIHLYIEILYGYDYYYTDHNLILDYKTNTVNYIDNYIIDIGMDMSWKTLEVLGIIKKYYNKTIVPGFHNITNDYFRTSILIIKNGEEVNLIKDIETLKKMDYKHLEYDLVYYTDYTLNDAKKNFTLIMDDINIIKNANDLIKHKSDINFIIFQLTIGDRKYDINLKEPKNFLIKNNTLKYPFFKWYMNKVYNIELEENFSVKYMLQDMSTGSVNSPFFIKFNENSVTSFSSAKPKPLVIEEEEEEEEEEHEEEEEQEEAEEEAKEADEFIESFSSNLINDIINNERLKQ